MKQYHDLLKHILEHGQDTSDRTGIGTRSVFGYQTRFNLEEGFPLLTTKKIHWKSVVHELLWFLKGDTNVKYLQENGVRIWDEWADEDGELGPVYGKQWRKWSNFVPASSGTKVEHLTGIPVLDDVARMRNAYVEYTYDQIAALLHEIKTKPNSRRMMVSAWNPVDVPKMKLPPCHALFQFNVKNGKLSCQLYQRSADAFLGVPFNIASYALLTHMVAHVCGLGVGDFIHTFGDLHIYNNHFDQVHLQLSREIRALPKLVLNEAVKGIDDFTFEDIVLDGYDPHPSIAAKVAV